ncbi:hypothetical protein [Chenggangzhangella methanolivorans]|uniref:Uncharacterized protein n=1 Tax=Chenggangzhangella methanolivorans TaxID=1437009 RepID=A0A9E6RAC8_9HYPH|nr:hypothetical protein [Chenggangzhangella methanolivorans]QZO01106.1 hypothetical protein K6K41_05910 [Chenggangzhangella methanolivorans]
MTTESDLVRNERLKALGLMFHQLAVAIFVAAVAVSIAAAVTSDGLALRYLAAAPVGLLLTSGCVALGQQPLQRSSVAQPGRGRARRLIELAHVDERRAHGACFVRSELHLYVNQAGIVDLEHDLAVDDVERLPSGIFSHDTLHQPLSCGDRASRE